MTPADNTPYTLDKTLLTAQLPRPPASTHATPEPEKGSTTPSAKAVLDIHYPADPEFQLRGGFKNPMVDAAMPLFGLAMRLRTTDTPNDIGALYADVHNQVTTVLEEIRLHPYEPAQQLAYSYALCLYLDESVLGTTWGNNSIWSHKPLLSEFHHETWGGEKFFTVLSRMMMEPQRYHDVLEFMYLCLCMGLRGKYAIQPKGDEALQGIISRLQRMIRDLRGTTPEQLSDPLSNVASRNFRINRQWPWWSPLLIAGALLATLYGLYTYQLQAITHEVLQSLGAILRL
ncbi:MULTISPECIES: type IVB secretion system protein IcmH/DotU [Pseudomonas]|uniref:type IVB secretion system protein IcmH/DotU n=1 Tax=Pseudomonas TaxID=286 RepID=UPI000A025EFB|nr:MULTISPECIES: type IVB secretion system protein IcmH/DotU [Pseudomonas]MCW2271225.1 type VI secretion system protein ImpK [Pseudomonas sp. JUb96]